MSYFFTLWSLNFKLIVHNFFMEYRIDVIDKDDDVDYDTLSVSMF